MGRPGKQAGGTSQLGSQGRCENQWRRHVARREEEEEGGIRSVWRRILHKLMKKGLTEVTPAHSKYNLLGEFFRQFYFHKKL